MAITIEGEGAGNARLEIFYKTKEKTRSRDTERQARSGNPENSSATKSKFVNNPYLQTSFRALQTMNKFGGFNAGGVMGLFVSSVKEKYSHLTEKPTNITQETIKQLGSPDRSIKQKAINHTSQVAQNAIQEMRSGNKVFSPGNNLHTGLVMIAADSSVGARETDANIAQVRLDTLLEEADKIKTSNGGDTSSWSNANPKNKS